MAVTLETQLEDYDLEREIGRGDLTIVYEAQRKSDGAKVAIKIVPPQFTFDELFVQRFQDAAHKATKLEHPNIVRTYETGQEDNVLYVVRELIQARSLAQILDEEGPMPPQKMMNIARQIAASIGPSGPNQDYLFNLAKALRELGDHDDHVFEIENHLR